MVQVDANLSNLIFWGGVNEEKSKAPTKWDHDILLNVTYSDKLAPIKNPEDIAAIIFDENKENIECEPYYEGVDEYRVKERKGVIEVVRGLEYTIIKIYGEEFNFDEINKRLKAAGMNNRKAKLEIDVPDRPKKLDESALRGFRYAYSEEEQEEDNSLSKKKMIKSIISGVIYAAVAIVVIVFVARELFVTKYKNVTPPAESFIGKKGNLIGYNAGGVLTLFAFASPVEELGVDDKALFLVPEITDVTDKVIVEKATDSLGNVIYEKGAKQVEFSSAVEGYDYAKANLFRFDTYRNRTAGEADWSNYGYLGTGKAKQIVIGGRIVKMEDGFYLSLGGGFAKLGDIAEEGERFYDKFTDSESYIAALYSLSAGRPVYVYGQIEKTFTPREGRNSKDKKLFSFRVTYVRSRAT